MFWIRPPVQVGVASVQLPPVPVTVKLPVRFDSTIPFAAPLADTLTNVMLLAAVVPLLTPVMLMAVPVVVVTDPRLMVTPLIVVPPLVKPADEPVERLNPRSLTTLLADCVLTVTVPCSVGRTPPIEGRATVPAGGEIPMRLSKLAPVAPWPISHSPALSAMASK